jgi:hypothetical protein
MRKIRLSRLSSRQSLDLSCEAVLHGLERVDINCYSKVHDAEILGAS